MAIFVAGHRGMVGGAIVQALESQNRKVITRTRDELDLTDQVAVRDFLAETQPEAVVLAAARVGGIHANNTYPAEFIAENLMIQTNVIDGAWRAGVETLLFLGSSCIYPRAVPQPMAETAILTGVLEQTNEPYAIAKIAGIKMCESYSRQYNVDYRSVMPTNLYGPGDNFHPMNSHVLPALMRRFHEAVQNNDPEVIIWGTGAAKREFMHVHDMAQASLFVMDIDRTTYSEHTEPQLSHINVGTGSDISILDLAQLLATVTGFKGEIKTNPSQPDGTARKLMDVGRLKQLGWQASIGIETGVEDTYRWYLENIDNLRLR